MHSRSRSLVKCNSSGAVRCISVFSFCVLVPGPAVVSSCEIQCIYIVHTYPSIGIVDYIPITVHSFSFNNIPQMSSFRAIIFYGFRNVLDIFPVTGNR